MQEPVHREISGVPFTCGKLLGTDVVIARAGVGKVNAAVCAQTMALIYEPELILNSGVSRRALRPELHVGDVVIARMWCSTMWNTTAMGDEPGFVSTVDRLSFPLDNFASTAIAAAAEELGIRAVRGAHRLGRPVRGLDGAQGGDRAPVFPPSPAKWRPAPSLHVCFLNRIPLRGHPLYLRWRQRGSAHVLRGIPAAGSEEFRRIDACLSAFSGKFMNKA